MTDALGGAAPVVSGDLPAGGRRSNAEEGSRIPEAKGADRLVSAPVARRAYAEAAAGSRHSGG